MINNRASMNYSFSLDNQSRPAYFRLVAPPALFAGFTLRTGGLSCGPYAAANMSYDVGDEAEAVAANRRALLDGAGEGRFSALLTCRQVHGRICKVVTRADLERPARLAETEADALLTAEPGVLLGILTADCLPLIIADKQSRACAVVHAGWRGLEKGVAVAALNEFERTFAIPAADLAVYAGPAIGLCCFEVGIEVFERFQKLPELKGFDGWYRKSGPAFYIDLPALQKRQLVIAGLDPADFHAVGVCTFCQDSCFSYRRDRAITGRQLAFVGISNEK